MKLRYHLCGLCLLAASLLHAATHHGVTINRQGTNKDGVMGIEVLSQSGLDQCNGYMLYAVDKALQATLLAGFSQGKKIRLMQWTNTSVAHNFGGTTTTCQIDYVDFEP